MVYRAKDQIQQKQGQVAQKLFKDQELPQIAHVAQILQK